MKIVENGYNYIYKKKQILDLSIIKLFIQSIK